MHLITLDSETDFEGWRKAARALVLNDVRPADVTWQVEGDEPELFAPETPSLPDAPEGTFNVSSAERSARCSGQSGSASLSQSASLATKSACAWWKSESL